jgi:hypothetical protein
MQLHGQDIESIQYGHSRKSVGVAHRHEFG